jgi:L-aminopeptidase/D-esterase-like protein
MEVTSITNAFTGKVQTGSQSLEEARESIKQLTDQGLGPWIVNASIFKDSGNNSWVVITFKNK